MYLGSLWKYAAGPFGHSWPMASLHLISFLLEKIILFADSIKRRNNSENMVTIYWKKEI